MNGEWRFGNDDFKVLKGRRHQKKRIHYSTLSDFIYRSISSFDHPI